MADHGVVVLHVAIGTPSYSECPMCGFDAFLTVDILSLSGSGVTVLGTKHGCARCEAIARG